MLDSSPSSSLNEKERSPEIVEQKMQEVVCKLDTLVGLHPIELLKSLVFMHKSRQIVF